MDWNSIKAEISTWYKSPFAANMSAGHWFLFLGFLLLAMAGWRVILSTILRD